MIVVIADFALSAGPSEPRAYALSFVYVIAVITDASLIFLRHRTMHSIVRRCVISSAFVSISRKISVGFKTALEGARHCSRGLSIAARLKISTLVSQRQSD